MHVGVKLGVNLAAVALAGGALGGVAAASQPPPNPGQDEQGTAQPRPSQEEGHGPGAIEVGPEGAAKALERLKERNAERARWCNGRVLPSNGLNVRNGPGTRYKVVDTLEHGKHVTTNWNSIQRRDGYLWVKLRHSSHWIADYKIGHGNGKWYIDYRNC
ncbi:SH3 domain-containing protein [Actinomadura sp. 7K507]|uniref:SH3 domain-containing protein n=1 Tax=Actinomadura sp. 7K507 TaxID=2530365 RepID=UPI00104C18B9|nr:SH3 domain-containing protein [Actinomadura sp. 7K507]TDC87949.1 SH3 domain-containing protein [Actinomadura sp. 7K507]